MQRRYLRENWSNKGRKAAAYHKLVLLSQRDLGNEEQADIVGSKQTRDDTPGKQSSTALLQYGTNHYPQYNKYRVQSRIQSCGSGSDRIHITITVIKKIVDLDPGHIIFS